ncbi:P-loop containing nucleoside triphosphate hydrolase protein, partial [Glonium stellatum]
FFQDTRILVDSDHAFRQVVIKELASDGGLERVRELVTADFCITSMQQAQEYAAYISPFFYTITHPDAISSALLEDSLSAIYIFLYGPLGRRAINVFETIIEVLKVLHQAGPGYAESVSGGMAEDSPFWALAAVSLEVFAKLMDFNGIKAARNEDLQPLVESFEQFFKDDSKGFGNPFIITSRRFLSRIHRQLGIAKAIPELNLGKSKAQANIVKPSFQIPRDMPGALSRDGARHDNDFEDICKIKILPTSEEIQSSRAEYLPSTEPSEWHIDGIDGVLDRQFRLLREDTIGSLRDAVRLELDQVQRPNTADRKGLSNTTRTYSYNNLVVNKVDCDQNVGLIFGVVVDQLAHLKDKPVQERRDWWERSRRLQLDTLVCIVDHGGTAIFCSVSTAARLPLGPMQRRLDSQKQGITNVVNVDEDPELMYLYLKLVEEDETNVKHMLKLSSQSRNPPKAFLVEFPKVLLPSFYPTLQALQSMSGKGDLPFSEILAPTSDSAQARIDIPPPTYTLNQGFRFDLQAVMNMRRRLDLQPSQSFDLDLFRKHSFLDDTQAASLIDALSRKMAIIQGPPGTGKSYTGVALIEVLLKNKRAAHLGPILCVCYTNHALDQLLEHLLDKGVTQIIRMGSRSKSERLGSLNLRLVAGRMSLTKTERDQKNHSGRDIKLLAVTLNNILHEMNEYGSWKSLEHYIRQEYPWHYQQLFGEDEDGWQKVIHNSEDWMSKWLQGRIQHRNGMEHGFNVRPLDELEATNVWDMTLPERKALYDSWLAGMEQDLRERFLQALGDFKSAKREDEQVRHELDIRCLQEANVIGVTLTGLARNLSLLRRLRSKVVICEEAGEVLEAHMLTAFLPTIEHAILIGDHQQLRPQISNYELQCDNPRGEQYSLDISLFERLVTKGQKSGPVIPFSILETQRRMHPSISQLIRSTLYPNLKDSPHVEEYPKVVGIKKRLFWFDHTNLEVGHEAQDAHSTSHSNDWEVEMAAALVSHLIRQGTYQANEVAVLTPYLGQLMKLRRKLGNTFEIVVNERDQDQLEKQGLMDNMLDQQPKKSSPIAKSSLLHQLKVATIDNFQGEEAKVVIISLVRSNPKNRVGFLRTSNRINVLLSRAMHGMYIVGNSTTAEAVPMWCKVLDILRSNENVGNVLELECPRHPTQPIEVRQPEDFDKMSPEGGCNQKCAKRLKCGHSCISRCHSDVLHEAVMCLEPCQRAKPGCDHPCPFTCGEECGMRCQVVIRDSKVTLGCGHVKTSLPCWQAQDPSSVRCIVPISRTVPDCKHNVELPCHVNIEAPDFKCGAYCGSPLSCGHTCRSACHECRSREEGEVVLNHGDCKQPCGRSFTACNHACRKACHSEKPCPPCSVACETRCNHSKCTRKCNEPCSPCAVEKCDSACPHSQCKQPCAAPCDWLPCSKRCQKELRCGHQCPSLCGEQCPDKVYCQVCTNSKSIKEMDVDYLEGKTYQEICLDEKPCLFPPCGHIVTVESMDGIMAMGDHYNLDYESNVIGIKSSSEPFSSDELKTCPKCRASLRTVARYGRIVRRALLDEATKRFISSANQGYLPLATKLQDVQEVLQKSQEQLNRNALPPTINFDGPANTQLYKVSIIAGRTLRYLPAFTLRNDIWKYLEKVRQEEMPFMKVWQMVETVRRRAGTSSEGSTAAALGISVPKATFQLLGQSLLMGCDLLILSDFVAQVQSANSMPSILLNLSVNRQDCLQLVKDAGCLKDRRREAEGHIFYARYCALERSVAFVGSAEMLKLDGRNHLAVALTLCTQYPGQTRGFKSEIQAMEKSFRENTFYEPVSDKERRDVLLAMTREFTGSGHWYTCANGHPFTVGDCGMPMELAQCPWCDARIGGSNHMPVEGVRTADDL